MYMTLFLVRWRHLSVAVGGKMGNSRTKSEMGLFTKNAKKKVNDQPLFTIGCFSIALTALKC